MKKLSFVFTSLAAVALTLASCSSEEKYNGLDEDLPEVLPDGRVEARFGAIDNGVEELDDTRSAWQGQFQENIGITAHTEDGSEIFDGYDNMEYRPVYSGSSYRFDAVGDGIYYSAYENERIKFSAYYPHQNQLENGIYKIDLTQGYDNIEPLLWCGITADSYNKKSSVVTLNMLRQYATIRIELVAGGGYDDADVKRGGTVAISDMTLKADFNVYTGECTATETGDLDVTPNQIQSNGLFFIYALPAEALSTRVVKIKLASGDEYNWEIGEKAFEAGHFYQYRLRINKVESNFDITIEDEVDGDDNVEYPDYIDLNN